MTNRIMHIPVDSFDIDRQCLAWKCIPNHLLHNYCRRSLYRDLLSDWLKIHSLKE